LKVDMVTSHESQNKLYFRECLSRNCSSRTEQAINGIAIRLDRSEHNLGRQSLLTVFA
jgi:hypothetical protein